MQSNSAELRHRISFTILFLMGSNLLIGNNYIARQDTWIAVLFSSLFLFLWSFVLYRISVLCPGESVFSLIAHFPKWVQLILSTIVILYCLDQAAITLRCYAGFVNTVSLPNTNIFFILFLSGMTVFFFLRNGESYLLRFSYFALIPIVLIMMVLFLFLSKSFRGELLYPILYDNAENVAVGALDNLSYPFGNSFLLLGMFTFPKDDRKTEWLYHSAFAVAGILTLGIVFQNILLLGGELCQKLDFPYNFSASLLNIGDFFSRIEVFSSLFFFLSAIVRTSFFMLQISEGLSTLFPSTKNSLAFLLTALLITYSAVAFKNTAEILNVLSIFRYYAIPLQFGLPILILVVVSVAHLRSRKGRP